MNTKLNQIEIRDWPELAREAKWSALAMAKECGVSVRTLHRHFLKHMGKNTRTWLTEQRRQKALDLLYNGSSVKETAGVLNYAQPNNFTRQFKCQTGNCPSKTPIVRK